MKPKTNPKPSRELRAALALLSLLATLAACWLAYVRVVLFRGLSFAPLFWHTAWLTLPFVVRMAYYNGHFFPILRALLALVGFSSAGAAWLALRR